MKTMGSRSSPALIAVLISAALASSACSEGASKEERYRTAVSNTSESIRPKTAEWATEVASDMNEQLQARGTIDVESVKGAAALSGEPVADSACETIKENDDVAALDDPSEPAGELKLLVDQELMAAIGRHPALIYDLKVTWPPSWLQDQAKPPDYRAPIQQLDPQWLRGFLRPEFVADDGAVRLPEEGDSQYRNFLAWVDQSDNTLAARASSPAGRVTEKLEDCIREL